ncbi:hypothetical protein ABDB83_003102, partial [Escherichia coli]
MKKLLLALLVSGYCHAEGLPACDDASVSKQVEETIAKELAVYNPNFLSDYSVTLYKPSLTKTEDNINYCTADVTFVNNKTKDDRMVSGAVFEILPDGKIEFSTYILSRVWSGGAVNFLALDEDKLGNHLDNRTKQLREQKSKEEARIKEEDKKIRDEEKRQVEERQEREYQEHLEMLKKQEEDQERQRISYENEIKRAASEGIRCDNPNVINRIN